jgi:serine phosphatase RsbU (regulator of sigma subunit)
MEMLLEKETKQFFIFFKPKDIVSGDFYYSITHKHPNTNELFYLCAADCTGHGVPGAFMSMLAISSLNKAIIEKNISTPSEILNDVRESIVISLNPEGSEEESKDGMDCVLCCYNFATKKLTFAAANNPLWLIRNNEILEYKPDKMPVGMHSGNVKSFTNYSIDLIENDVIYIFTDGYQDQFGGEKGKKFKASNLKTLLLNIHKKTMQEQETIIAETFEKWKGNIEQIDDVCLIGLKI